MVAGALGLGALSSLAQDNNPPGGPPPGAPGGQAGFGGQGRFGRGNFGDPAQRQQMMMDRLKQQLEITDEAEWKAIEPLIQKVSDIQRQMMGDRMRGFFGPRRAPDSNDQNRDQNRRNLFGQASPEAEALQRAIDGKASSTEMKAAITKFVEARKTRQAELEKAQANLRKVLTVKQEAVLTLDGML